MEETSDLDAAGLFVGEVMHQRLRPFRHRFVYRVFSLLLDIDRVDDVAKRLWLFSGEGRNLVSFRNRDHGYRDGTPLRPWVENELRRTGLAITPGRVLLLAMPRILGYVFNPLSVYYVHDGDDGLRAIIYEVKNTFGGQHPYVLPVFPDGEGPVRHGCGKDFYVSPFIAMTAAYRFKLTRPGQRLSVVIQEDVEGKTGLVASFTAERQPLTDRALARALITTPLLTHKVIAGIHFEALRLWLKGARLQPRPAHGIASPLSLDGTRQ